MAKGFLDRFKGDGKYFSIVFFIFILFLLTAILSPYLTTNLKENWGENLSDKITSIENSTTDDFKQIENNLIQTANSAKHDLRRILINNNISYGRFVRVINKEKFNDYSLEILAPNGKLIAWNAMIAVPQENIFPLDYPIGETYFFNSDLAAFLTITDTIIFDSDVFYLICSLPFEKKYVINNTVYKDINFSKQISEKYSLQAKASINPFELKSTDGRKYSFDLLNNKNNKIGQVTITKPILDVELNKFNYLVELIQSILVFLAFVFLGFGFRSEFRKLNSQIYKLVLLLIYLSVFRYIIYQLGFPANLAGGILSDPSFFSSAFAGGIVRSPIEFFITAVFFTIICIKIYQYGANFIFSQKADRKVILSKYFLILFVPLVLIYFLGIRGLSASLRSVIFDSSLRYFRGTELIPEIPAMIMNLNVLILGFSVTLILSLIITALLLMISRQEKRYSKRNFTLLYLVFQGAGVIFILIQRQPLVNYWALFFFNTLLFGLAYHIYFRVERSKYVFVYAAVCGSIISIIQLNYFNLDLERESLKTIAIEINRPNDNLFRFMISEVLLNSVKDENLIAAVNSTSANFNSTAYSLWCQSSFQRESVNSSISILDEKGNVLGKFWSGDEKISEDIKPAISLINSEPIILDAAKIDQSGKRTLTGIIPLKLDVKKLGFLSASMNWDPSFPVSNSSPEFLQSKGNVLNSVIDFSQLKIFEFSNSKLAKVYGDIYPSRDQILPIISSDFTNRDDVWLTLNLNEEKYFTYALRHNSNGNENITAVSLLEKKFSWDIYNFFKLFIVQFIFILVLLISFFVYDVKNFRYTFRFQLTIAFLLISLIPVIILALYNRQLVEKRTDEAIFNELKTRANYVQKQIQSQIISKSNLSLVQMFDKAADELGVAFAVFDNTLQIFNSQNQFFEAGVFSERINPQVYYNLNYLSYREYNIKEQIENYTYNSFYKKISIEDKNYILAVSDIFNKVKLTFSTSDLDVLLFGIYLLAAIIIVLISTLLADKISLPIRRLTKATVSVAQGDLNISLENKEKGELKDLLDGFNSMTEDLKKNQSELSEMEREAAWKEMAKQVAHEIKNPLTPMKLSVQHLIASFRGKNKNFDEIFEKVSSTILNQIESLSSIASEFSRFAKMPSFKIEEVDLESLVKDVITLFTEESVTFDVELDEHLPKVNADNSQVRRLLINLIRNAIQAKASKIKLTVYHDSDRCSLIIDDNGKGIPVEIRNKIFDQDFTTKAAGMGLGLKLVKRFLDGIGGTIELIEKNDPGTIFKVTFPVSTPIKN